MRRFKRLSKTWKPGVRFDVFPKRSVKENAASQLKRDSRGHPGFNFNNYRTTSENDDQPVFCFFFKFFIATCIVLEFVTGYFLHSDHSTDFVIRVYFSKEKSETVNKN